MSATNHTTNYELPIFVGTDKPAWLVDWNGAMTAIDTAIHTAEGKADQAGTDIGGIESSITTINGTLTSINNAVSQLRIDTNANTGNINTINSLIGNGEPTTTDKTLIGAINEINANVSDLGALTTSEKVIGTFKGKPLYRKIIECTSPTTEDTNESIYTQLTSAMVIRKLDGFLQYTGDSQYPVNFYLANDDYISCWRRSGTEIGMRVSKSAYTSKDVVFVVEYTKSND